MIVMFPLVLHSFKITCKRSVFGQVLTGGYSIFSQTSKISLDEPEPFEAALH